MVEITEPFLDVEVPPVNARLVKLQRDMSHSAVDPMTMREEERVVVVEGVIERDVSVSVPDVADAREWVRESEVKANER